MALTLVQFDFSMADKVALIGVCERHDLPEIKECLKTDGSTILSRREAIELANASRDDYPHLRDRIYRHPVVAEGLRRMYAYIKRLRNTRLYNLDCEGPDTFQIHQEHRARQKERFRRRLFPCPKRGYRPSYVIDYPLYIPPRLKFISDEGFNR